MVATNLTMVMKNTYKSTTKKKNTHTHKKKEKENRLSTRTIKNKTKKKLRCLLYFKEQKKSGLTEKQQQTLTVTQSTKGRKKKQPGVAKGNTKPGK